MEKKRLEQIRKLRSQTRAPVLACKKALEETGGDIKRACEILRKRGIRIAEEKADRVTREGRVEAYIHANGRVGAIVEVGCETDFVARNPLFKNLSHELAMQVTAMKPKDIRELLAQPYIRDEKKNVDELVKEAAGKLGENIVVKRFVRLELGEGG